MFLIFFKKAAALKPNKKIPKNTRDMFSRRYKKKYAQSSAVTCESSSVFNADIKKGRAHLNVCAAFFTLVEW